jgi:predicted ABC-type ATPase
MDLYIIAGPNGAGKTTFAREFLPNYADCKNFVNADLIAEAMGPSRPRLPPCERAERRLGISGHLLGGVCPSPSKLPSQAEAI